MIDPETPLGNNNFSDPLTSTREEYPRRESYFSHRFCRLLAKSAAAQSIGPEACWMLSIIVHTEDAKRYTGPVMFWNEQLMSVCGFGGRTRLVRARDKAVEAGWLHYEPGSKATAGKYWVKIPPQFVHLPDSPVDENRSEYLSEDSPPGDSVPNQDSNRTATERDSVPNQDRMKSCHPKSGRQPSAILPYL